MPPDTHRLRGLGLPVACAAALLIGWVGSVGCGESQQAPDPGATGPPPESEIPPPPSGPVALKPVFTRLPTLDQPTALLQAPGDTSRWWVLEQPGRLRTFESRADADAAPVALDIRDKVLGPEYNWEAGLVGLAFHPRFADNGRLYLFYTAPSASSGVGSKIVLSRFELLPDRSAVDPGSETVILTRECGHPSYNGGTVVFGPDGLLYVGMGQNVPSDTEPHPSQDPHRLEGTLLRIDVDGGDPYAIPPDNPFASGGGAPEVYAYGFRNPWKFSFDRESGALWLGDVAEHSWEEIDRVLPGRNYGWNLVEGDQCRSDCPPDYEPPVHAYPGRNSAVVGGYVYRGRAVEALRGAYLFADFMRNQIWSLEPHAGGYRPRLLIEKVKALRQPGLVGTITTFAEDAEGELFVATRSGRIFQLVPRQEMWRRYLGIE